jgi:hypothetical protein
VLANTSQLAHIERLNRASWQRFLCSKPMKSEEPQAIIAG